MQMFMMQYPMICMEQIPVRILHPKDELEILKRHVGVQLPAVQATARTPGLTVAQHRRLAK